MSPVCPLIPYAEVFMTEFISIVAIVALIFLFIKIISLPMRLIFKILINAASGYVCLFLLNMLAEYTGVVFELTFLSAAIVGFLGLPGIVLLLVLQFFL